MEEWRHSFTILDLDIGKEKLSLLLINEASLHEDIWRNGGIAPPFLT
jgi:hypothetical protein